LDESNNKYLSTGKSFPRKTSEPINLQSTHQSIHQFLKSMPPKNIFDPCGCQRHYHSKSASGLGYHASAHAALRRHSRHSHMLGLSAYENHLAKRSNTESVMAIQNPMKGTISHMQGLLDSAFALMHTDAAKSIIEGAKLANEVLSKAWMTPRNGRNLAYTLCDYVR
jgi:hypothetical protein